MERRLTAILSADVKGYSILVAEDDEAAMTALMACRERIARAVEQHQGRVVDAPGDNVLAAFASVVDAVRCGLAIQQALHEHSVLLPNGKPMLFRIGINAGDVIIQEGQLYGDAVIIAARLEGLAEPGGICISSTVHEQVKNKLPIRCEDIGAHQVKNIAEPVRAWRIVMSRTATSDAGATAPRLTAPAQGATKIGLTSRLLTVAVLVTLLLGTGFWWFASHRPARLPGVGDSEPARDKPGIVVLPFANMSDDPGQDYFCDGIAEDLTTDLAKISSLFVISRTSAVAYRQKAIPLPDIAHELGVRYVVEGSVQRAGKQIRVNVQLIDTAGDEHLWAERYDRPIDDLFAVQDEIRGKIATALKVKLSPDEQARFRRAPTASLEAYDLYLRGQDAVARSRVELKPELLAEAKTFYRQAIELDPGYARAYAALGMVEWLENSYRWNTQARFTDEHWGAYFEKALALDDTLPDAHFYMAREYIWRGQYEEAIDQIGKGLALDPNHADGYYIAGSCLAYLGAPSKAFSHIQKALQINPHHPLYWAFGVGLVYLEAGHVDDAKRVLRESIARGPNLLGSHLLFAVIHARSGELEAARREVDEIRRISPDANLATFMVRWLSFRDQARRDEYASALRAAGLE